jgi:hypothetical protein
MKRGTTTAQSVAVADTGIWMKDLRYKTTLAAQPVSKSVRLLEERRLIKPVTAWDNPSRKMYMAFDVVPRKSTVGSSWYASSLMLAYSCRHHSFDTVVEGDCRLQAS